MHSCQRPRMKTDNDAALFLHRIILSVLKSAHLQYVELGCSGHIPLHWHSCGVKISTVESKQITLYLALTAVC